MSDFIVQVQQRLQVVADAGKAATMSAYMRNRFPFLGIQTPQRRRQTLPLIRSFAGNPVQAAGELWALPQREYQYVGVDLLRQQRRQLTGEQLPALEELVLGKSWWDTVDGLAVTIGNVVWRERGLATRMDALIHAPELWLRRVALLHQLDWKADTDEERLFAYCRQCADEPAFFIRKAIGWALRQYARSNPDAVRQFLEANRERFSGLSLREAAKHL